MFGSDNSDRAAVGFSLFVVRLASGVIFAAHGAQKMFGMWGGHGLAATVAPPPDGMGPLGYLVSIGECFGGLGLILGVLTRFSAASLIVIMIGAISMVHGKNGFFMDPKGLADGYEYNLALIGLLMPTFLAGPGWLAIGRFLPIPKSGSGERPLMVLE